MYDDTAMLAALGGVAIFAVVFALVLCVLTIVAMWKIFTKAGEAGWKSIIPVYNLYILFKIAWDVKFFWAVVACYVLQIILTAANVAVLSALVGIAMFVLVIILYNYLSKAFGHGAGFTVGLVLLNTIFILILGLGSSQYIGNQFTGEAPAADTTPEYTAPTYSSNDDTTV